MKFIESQYIHLTHVLKAALENEVGIRQCRPINLPGRKFLPTLILPK
jgi:hypothetical protein